MPPDTIAADTIWFVEIVWADGSRTAKTADARDLGGLDWATWIENYLVKATARPFWARIGDLVFYTQNVRSVDLIETIDKED